MHLRKMAALLSVLLLLSLAWATQAQVEPVIPVEPVATQDPNAPGNVPSLENAGQFGQQGAAPSDSGAGDQPQAVTQPQATDTCPALIEQAFTATQLSCEGAAAGRACIGNGIVEATARSGDLAFAQPGDTARFSDLSTLRVRTSGTENNLWAVVQADAQFNTTAGSAAAATLVFFGDVNVTDAGEAFNPNVRTGSILATRGLNVRRAPDNQSAVVFQLQFQDSVTVTGLSVDEQWVRIEIPSVYANAGWVYAPYIDVEGGAETLPTVTQDSPRPQLDRPDFGPMQAFTLSSTLYDTCPNVPDSGVLLQSQSGVASDLRVRVNGAELAFNGTLFVQAIPNDTLRVTVLEGNVTVVAGGTGQGAGRGNQVSVPIDASLNSTGTPSVQPFDLMTLGALPISLLPRQFALVGGQPAQADAPQGQLQTGGQQASVEAGGTPPTTPDSGCRITASDGPVELRNGPGEVYAVAGALALGETLVGDGIALSADGSDFWYRTPAGWVRVGTVTTTEACQSLAPVSAPPPG